MNASVDAVAKAAGAAAVLTAAVLVMALTGCQTTVVKDKPDQAEDWTYAVRIARVGERQGGEWGYLFYRGREVLSFFESIVIDGTRYDYVIRESKGEFGGYRRRGETPGGEGETGPETAGDGITPEQLERGWYLAGPVDRRLGTPEHWVWVKRLNIEAFVDPSQIGRFTRTFDISPIIDEEYDRDEVRFHLGFGFGRRL